MWVLILLVPDQCLSFYLGNDMHRCFQVDTVKFVCKCYNRNSSAFLLNCNNSLSVGQL